MNGDLSHPYVMKNKDKWYLCNYMIKSDYDEEKMGTTRICKLLFNEKDKLSIIYDFGDNWRFDVTIAKIFNNHNEKNFTLLDGIGKGIEDDCGGISGLENLINNKDNDWGYDIADFNIDKINEIFDKYYNKRH